MPVYSAVVVTAGSFRIVSLPTDEYVIVILWIKSGL